jgi:hypothetical protein
VYVSIIAALISLASAGVSVYAWRQALRVSVAKIVAPAEDLAAIKRAAIAALDAEKFVKIAEGHSKNAKLIAQSIQAPSAPAPQMPELQEMVQQLLDIERAKAAIEAGPSLEERREMIKEQNSPEFQQMMIEISTVRATPNWLLKWGQKKVTSET